MKKLDRRLIRMIGHSKGQFISIVTIVTAALAIYILFNITSININNAVADYYDQTHIADVQVELMKIPAGALQEIRKIEGVSEVAGRLSFDVSLKVADDSERVTVRLITQPNETKLNTLYTISGDTTNIQAGEGVVLQQFATARSIHEGDILTPVINGLEYPLTMKGVAASSEFIYLMENEQALMPNPDKFGVIYVPEIFGQTVYGYLGAFNEVLIAFNQGVDQEALLEKIEQELNPYGLKRMIKLEDQLSYNVLKQKMDGIEKMANVIPVMFLFVGAIIIVIMLSRIVSNDRIAIGVMKALGYTDFQVLSHYTKYALSIGLVGSVVGIIVGLGFSGPLSQVFVFFFNIPFVKIAIYPDYILKAMVLTSIFCAGSGIIGAKGILKVMPADSMRPEAPKSGKRIWLERLPAIWRRMGFSWKMVIRNVMRMKRRFVMLTFGLAMAYGINTVPLFMGDSVPLMFDIQYNQLQKMDYTVEFNKPMNESVLQDLGHLVDASQMEPKLQMPFELKNRWFVNSAIVIGLPMDTQLYAFEDLKSRKTVLKPNRIYLTEALAKSLKVQAGQTLLISSFIPGKEDVSLEVGPILHQFLGSNAYMDIKTMQRLMMDEQLITGANLTSTDDVKDKLKDVSNIALVRSASDIKDSFMMYMDTLIVATNAYMLFGGILGFALVYNATVIGISERKLEFSSLRVMGFDKKEVFKIVTRENMLLGICSVIVGIPLGMGMIKAMSESFSSEMITFPSTYSPKVFVIAAIAAMVYILIAQLAARKKIYELDFIEALKSRIS